MPYGIASADSVAILTAAGLREAVAHEQRDGADVFEVDIVIGGALDESFVVDPAYGSEVVDALYEHAIEVVPSYEAVVVDLWNRTNPDDVDRIYARENSEASEQFSVLGMLFVEVDE
jgi:hypothetical protein